MAQPSSFANLGSKPALYSRPATGAGDPKLLTETPFLQQSVDVSSDRKFLVFTHISRSAEIMVLPMTGGSPLSYLGHARGAAHPFQSRNTTLGCL
jgi:hypothetical protein